MPGGKIEFGESPAACSERETLEETGYRVAADQRSEVIKTYTHEWNGQNYLCETYFYRGTLTEPWHEPRPVKDADYNQGARWLKLPTALKHFKYQPEILSAVRELADLDQTK